MSETSQHTPGPWEIPSDNSLGRRLTVEKGLSHIPWRAVVGQNNRAVCLVLTPRQGETSEDVANARLIIAAPQSLEWLIQCERYLRHPDVREVTRHFSIPPNLIALNRLIDDIKGEED